MPEKRFTEIPALSVDPKIGISGFAPETDDRFYFSFVAFKDIRI